jgi:hypothetical protein
MWQLAKNAKGYGRVGIAPGKMALAHRVYYEQYIERVPDGFELHHLCKVPGCVKPEHLVPKTRREHLRISGKLKLNPADVIEIRRSTEKQRVLAERYGVSQSLISRIKARLVWRDVLDPCVLRDAEPTHLVSVAGASEQSHDLAEPELGISKLAA